MAYNPIESLLIIATLYIALIAIMITIISSQPFEGTSARFLALHARYLRFLAIALAAKLVLELWTVYGLDISPHMPLTDFVEFAFGLFLVFCLFTGAWTFYRLERSMRKFTHADEVF